MHIFSHGLLWKGDVQRLHRLSHGQVVKARVLAISVWDGTQISLQKSHELLLLGQLPSKNEGPLLGLTGSLVEDLRCGLEVQPQNPPETRQPSVPCLKKVLKSLCKNNFSKGFESKPKASRKQAESKLRMIPRHRTLHTTSELTLGRLQAASLCKWL